MSENQFQDDPDAAEEAERCHQLTNPRFDLIEAHFGCQVPVALRNLYDNHSEIVRTGLFLQIINSEGKTEEWYLQCYEAIKETTLLFFEGFEKYIEIALCFGPFLYVVDPTETDPEVYLFNIDEGELHPQGIRLSQFVAAPRRDEDKV